MTLSRTEMQLTLIFTTMVPHMRPCIHIERVTSDDVLAVSTASTNFLSFEELERGFAAYRELKLRANYV